MKKLVGVLVLAAVVYGGWRWSRPAEEPETHNKIVNRFWVDHMPTNEKDMIKVFVLWQPESFGAFRVESHWRVHIERFRYEARDGKLSTVFPQSGEREELTLKAWRCDEAEMDYCLEVTGSKHGVKRYYSRNGWERRDMDFQALLDEAR